ncbi:unnamed protein product [Absidia cylindrospora]
MANILSLLARRHKPLSGFIIITLVFTIFKARQQYSFGKQAGKNGQQQQGSTTTHDTKTKQGEKKQHKVGVNSQFVDQMKRLLPICIPGLLSKELALLFILATVLIARTWLDIW